VEYSDNSSSNSTAWNWTFPGGTPSTSTAQNPSVTYNTPGTYAVTLEASNVAFSSTQTEMSFITIDDVPSAGFTTTTNGAIVEFTNTSNNATTYLWDFGDGNMSTEINPTHTYATDGDFTVILTATNDCGSSTTEVLVTSTFLPSANFFIQNMMDCAPATIQFVDNSTSNTTSWNWTFDGGSPNTSSVQNPAITFNTPGVHEITLVASNAAGSSTFSMQITLDSPPVVDFSSSVNLLTTTFTNLSTNADTSFWDLGDGNSSPAENPIHDYAVGGNYNVILTATNACGTTTFMQQVEVLGPQAVAGFMAIEENGCTPFTVEFEDTSTGSPTAWAWEFPGGSPSTSTEQHPTIVYNNVGTYDVTLTVSNPAGNNSVVQNSYITVGEGPTANFTSSIDIDGTVTFVNTSQLGNSYQWDFGNGMTSIEENPVLNYDSSGTYLVELIVSNDCGTDIFTQEIVIQITSTIDVSFLEKLDLYPNPNNGQFILHLEGQPLDDLELRFYNIIGQEVLFETIDFSSGILTKSFDLQELPAATYILQIKSENQLVHRKVVKE